MVNNYNMNAKKIYIASCISDINRYRKCPDVFNLHLWHFNGHLTNDLS